ncbi:uncharacterized protein LOC133785322 [Humulus lupulus]|uniref:uncharacterized protein LOC133785322 n=1 Tax=Humulus lupulus TaxID=3486 RepID=UPI002B406061|nr:uncharacterized protein LOC133785322 [Humulus lupulus]
MTKQQKMTYTSNLIQPSINDFVDVHCGSVVDGDLGSQSTSSFAAVLTEVPELRDDNFKIWKEIVLFHLRCASMEYAITNYEPATIKETSTEDEIALRNKWERSNRLSIMFIMTKIPNGMCGSVEQHEKFKDFIKAIEEQYNTFDKPINFNTLFLQLSSSKLTRIRGVREHITKIRDTAEQLKKFNVEITESFLGLYILSNLPSHHMPFKISYNTHKDKVEYQ